MTITPLIRYVTTHINRDGYRQLTGHNQGHAFAHTEIIAQARLQAFHENNRDSTLSQVFGPQALGTFEVRPVECYDSGDAKGIYFDA